MIAEKIKGIIARLPLFLFIDSKFANAAMHLTSIQVIDVCLPPRGVGKPFEFVQDTSNRRESFR